MKEEFLLSESLTAATRGRDMFRTLQNFFICKVFFIVGVRLSLELRPLGSIDHPPNDT
jgi:hypothetical protein